MPHPEDTLAEAEANDCAADSAADEATCCLLATVVGISRHFSENAKIGRNLQKCCAAQTASPELLLRLGRVTKKSFDFRRAEIPLTS